MKKKIETKKILAIIIIVFGLVWVSSSYVLAAMDIYQTNENVSSAVVISIIGVYLSYCMASFSEKNSRNKYNINENGEPIGKNDCDINCDINSKNDCDRNGE